VKRSDLVYMVEIVFKGGAKTVAPFLKFSVQKNALGTIHAIEWKTPPGLSVLRLDPGEVAMARTVEMVKAEFFMSQHPRIEVQWDDEDSASPPKE
jgi:hypothetical protein